VAQLALEVRPQALLGAGVGIPEPWPGSWHAGSDDKHTFTLQGNSSDTRKVGGTCLPDACLLLFVQASYTVRCLLPQDGWGGVGWDRRPSSGKKSSRQPHCTPPHTFLSPWLCFCDCLQRRAGIASPISGSSLGTWAQAQAP
jgi:hypothetical protein